MNYWIAFYIGGAIAFLVALPIIVARGVKSVPGEPILLALVTALWPLFLVAVMLNALNDWGKAYMAWLRKRLP